MNMSSSMGSGGKSLQAYLVALALWSGILAGCDNGPNAGFVLYPVKGKIAWKDGRALPNRLSVTLQSMGEGNIQAITSVTGDGKFSNVIFIGFGGDGRNGTIAGQHKVLLKFPVPYGEEAVSMTPEQRQEAAVQARLFEPFSTFEKSPLIVEIKPESNDLNIELTPPTSAK